MAMAQALPTETRGRVFVVDQAALGHVLLPVFRLSLSVPSHQCRTQINLHMIVTIRS